MHPARILNGCVLPYREAAQNVAHAGGAAASQISLLQADATRLPLHSNTIDAILCDMPFGRRHVAHSCGRAQAASQHELYPMLLAEFHRVLKPGACAVRHARNNM